MNIKNLSELEQFNGKLAASLIADHGGEMTLAEYDAAMLLVKYFVPFGWSGRHYLSNFKSSDDKRCLAAAIILDLIEPTETGYKLK